MSVEKGEKALFSLLIEISRREIHELDSTGH